MVISKLGFTNSHPTDEYAHQVEVGGLERVVPGGSGLVHHPEQRAQVQVPWRFRHIEAI